MLMIYGAYGYTGELIVKRALECGVRPIIAGRSATKLGQMAANFGLEARTVGLEDQAQLRAALSSVSCVLHCAGPFQRTSAPMLEACLATSVHYLDITGEVSVFEALARRDAQAKTQKILVLPGVGFDVVPSDCLAQHLKMRLPSATHLELGLSGNGGISHGTMTTALELMGVPTLVRRNGELTETRLGSLTRNIDFGRGPRTSMAMIWGDVSSAYHSTGIPNITVYWRAAKAFARGARLLAPIAHLAQARTFQHLAQRLVDARIKGPYDETRARARSVIWGEVTDGTGGRKISRLTAPEGYTLTAQAAVHIAQKVLEGRAPVGYHTPSTAFGADLVLELPGVQREDLS